jgi:hypothetical protein
MRSPGPGHPGPLKTVPGRRDQSLLASRAGTVGVGGASRGHDFHAPLNRRLATHDVGQRRHVL